MFKVKFMTGIISPPTISAIKFNGFIKGKVNGMN